MAKLGGFNATEHAELDTFDVIPPADYTAQIVESEMKENNAKTGSYLKLKFKLTEGKFKGRVLWTNLNLDHPNADAVEIANRHLASICKSVGIISPDDSQDLHGIEMSIKVTVKKASASYPESNEIKSYKKLDGVSSPSKESTKPEAAVAKKNKRVSFD